MTELPPPKMCPILTTVQVVPRNFEMFLQAVPDGEVKIAAATDLMKARSSPLDLASIAKTALVYKITGLGGLGLRTPEGTKPTDTESALIAETLVVVCQRDGCAFWCDEQNDCRLVISSSAATLSAARALITKAHENYDTNMGEEPEEEGRS